MEHGLSVNRRKIMEARDSKVEFGATPPRVIKRTKIQFPAQLSLPPGTTYRDNQLLNKVKYFTYNNE